MVHLNGEEIRVVEMALQTFRDRLLEELPDEKVESDTAPDILADIMRANDLLMRLQEDHS